MNTLMMSRVTLGAVLIVTLVSCSVRSQEIVSVTAANVDSLAQSDSTIVLLDVRTRGEFDGELGHLKGAVLIPIQELSDRLSELQQFKPRTIIAYCHSGRRSATATSLLVSKGFHALNMEGGMLKWGAERRPVVYEHPTQTPRQN